MVHYRNFIIDARYLYASDGKFDGYYYQEGDEFMTPVYRQSLDSVKDDIDTLIYEGRKIRVITKTRKSHTITKFDWLDQAVAFAAKVNGEVKILFNGREHTIDTI